MRATVHFAIKAFSISSASTASQWTQLRRKAISSPLSLPVDQETGGKHIHGNSPLQPMFRVCLQLQVLISNRLKNGAAFAIPSRAAAIGRMTKS